MQQVKLFFPVHSSSRNTPTCVRMPAESKLSYIGILLLVAILVQVTLSAPANSATARYGSVQVLQEQEQAHAPDGLLRQRSITLARTRNSAVFASRNASRTDSATSSRTASSSSFSSSAPSSTEQPISSYISLTRENSPSGSSYAQSNTSTFFATATSSASPSSSFIESSSLPAYSNSSTSLISSPLTTTNSGATSPSSSPPSASASTSRPASTFAINATSTSSTSSAATSAVSPGKAPVGCSCGYRLNNFNDQYLRSTFSIDFRQYSSVSQLQSAGMTIANGYQIGNTAPDGTYAYGMASNVRFGNDGVHLVVPGNQTAGGQVTGAQLIFNNKGRGMTRMHAEADIQVDATPGTCQAFWTFTNNLSASSDEQDMEVIAASLLTDSEVHEAGLQLTNHAPDKSGNKDHRTVPFPSDPSVGFHKYTIAWDRRSVSYSIDGQRLDGPTEDVSQNPSNLLLNHWASGNIGFFGAPLPVETVTMRVRSIRLYYETDFDSSLPSGCTESDVCVV